MDIKGLVLHSNDQLFFAAPLRIDDALRTYVDYTLDCSASEHGPGAIKSVVLSQVTSIS